MGMGCCAHPCCTPSIPTASPAGKASPALLSVTSKDGVSFHPSQAAAWSSHRDTESMENLSWDVPAGITTSSACSSTPEPVPALEIKDFFPSVESEALASLQYHRHAKLSILPAPPQAGEVLTQKSWHWDEEMQSKS